MVESQFFYLKIFRLSVKVQRVKSVSCNLIWLRVKADGWFIIFCALYIPPESRSYNEEDTWRILEDEKRKFSIQFPSDLFGLMGTLMVMLGLLQKF